MGKIKREDRKDRRGGGYAKRKFTYEQAELIREKQNTVETVSRLYKKIKNFFLPKQVPEADLLLKLSYPYSPETVRVLY